jgi:hypothetical protein
LIAASSRRERSKEEDKEDKLRNEEDDYDKDINVLYDKESSKKPSSLHKTILNKLGPWYNNRSI